MSKNLESEVATVRRRGSGAQSVYESLRRDILCLDLSPGSLMDEVELSRRFSMSRSPIREALIRLSMEGLVTTLPNKSSLVSPLKLEEFPAYADAIDLVQRITARLAARLRTPSDLENMRAQQVNYAKALEAEDIFKLIETNRDFHMAISNAARNSYYDYLHARLLDDGRRILHLYYRSFGGVIPQTVGQDHVLILKAIELGDEDLAEKCAHDHVTQVNESFLSYLSSRHTLDFKITPPE